MIFWLVIALMLAVVMAALLWPLWRGHAQMLSREAYDANIYRDQLRAIDEELAEGLIEPEDAEAARLEISRKLLAVAEKTEKAAKSAKAGKSGKKGRGGKSHKKQAASGLENDVVRPVIYGLALLVPLSAILLYFRLGHPDMPDQPILARRAAPAQERARRIKQLFAMAEKHLAEHPNDGRGWAIMAPVYFKNGYYNKAADAYHKAGRLLKPRFEYAMGEAESMVLAHQGKVGDDVLPVLKQAIRLDPKQPRPRFLLALHDEQNGRYKEAEKIYTILLSKSDEKVFWRKVVQERLDAVRKAQGLPPKKIKGVKTVKQPDIKLGDALSRQLEQEKKAAASQKGPLAMKGPSAEDMKRAARMSPAARQAMIKSMVARLSKRLYAKGGDANSWMRLVRVYNVLGKRDEALKAVRAARKNLKGRAGEIARLNAFAKKLGLGS